MENCHHDHVPFNLKGNENIVVSVCSEFDTPADAPLDDINHVVLWTGLPLAAMWQRRSATVAPPPHCRYYDLPQWHRHRTVGTMLSREIPSWLPSNWKEYDRIDIFLFHNQNKNCHSDRIPFKLERIWSQCQFFIS